MKLKFTEVITKLLGKTVTTIQLSKNKTISLYGKNIGDEGAKSIAQALHHNNSVTAIHLHGNKIGTELLKDIDELLEKNKLQAAEALKFDQTIDSSFQDHPDLDSIKNNMLSLKANKPTDFGDTLMHIAHAQGNKEDIRLLHQYGAKTNVQNVQGKTPLHCLLESKEVSTATKVEIIQEFHQLYSGKTVRDYAMEYCQESLPLLGEL